MPGIPFKSLLILAFGLYVSHPVMAQDTAFKPKHAAIFFPYPMYKEKWRSSIGFTLLTTPQDITEEVRIRIPCGDFRVLRRINDHFIMEGRLQFQFIQNHSSVGIHFIKPITNRFFFGAGNDMGFWFGFLNISGFNSRASGWLNYSNISLGYKTNKELLVTFKAQFSYNLHYEAANGDEKYSSANTYYNGETFTLAFEQPFYHQKHIILAFSTINNYFYWQTWALFYKTNRKVFSPQITVGLIL
jgi:hypothetical protein